MAAQAAQAAHQAQAAAAAKYAQAQATTQAAQASAGAAFAESANAAKAAKTVQSAEAFKQWALDQVRLAFPSAAVSHILPPPGKRSPKRKGLTTTAFPR